MAPPDALACSLAWLRTHPDLPAQLRDGEVGRVSSRELDTYPCLRVRQTPGGAGGLQWQVGVELEVELLDTDVAAEQIGDELTLHLLQSALWLLHDLTDEPQPIPGRREVVTAVSTTSGPALVPEPGAPAQARWVATVTVNAHPAAQPQTQED